MNRQWAGLFLTLFVMGCPKRLNFGPQGEVTSAEQLLRLVCVQESNVISLEGEGRFKMESPAQSGASGLFVAVHRPALVRLEALDFFGRPLAVLVCDGERFGLFNAQEGRYYKGPATATNMARLLPIALAPQELVAVMLGQPPRIPAESEQLSVDRSELAYLLTLKAGNVTQFLRIHPSYHRVEQSRVVGAPTYDVDYEDFKEKGGVVFPGKVTLSAKASGTRVELVYKDIKVNGPVDLTLFEVTPPPGVPITEVDGQGNPR